MNRTINRFHDGVTLMEVLAAMFVISIGLLGVLAVFPFGAHQVSKGRNAEHVANMLAAAGQNVQIMELTQAEKWVVSSTPTSYTISVLNETGDTTTILSVGGVFSPNANQNAPGQIKKNGGGFNCTRIYILDPFVDSATLSDRFFRIGADFTRADVWREIMRGQDDLVYTLHDNKRTDFSGQGSTVASSGKYTWFMTFNSPNAIDDGNGKNEINVGTGGPKETRGLTKVNILKDDVTVDLLGCYNRVPGAERIQVIDAATYAKTLSGAQLTLKGTDEQLDLSKTKYIYVTWERYRSNGNPKGTHLVPYDGAWCKIVYAPKNVTNGGKTIVVKLEGGGALPGSFFEGNSSAANPAVRPRALIVDGVLYHKSLAGQKLF